MQPTHVRRVNRRAVLSVICLQPGVSNAELARLTRLAPQTVSAVLADLQRAHLITRGEVLRGRRGQPATPVYMNPTGAFAVGAEIGWRHIEVCLVGLGAVTLARYRRAYAYPDARTVFVELGQAVAQVTAGLSGAERARLTGLGLAAPSGIGDPAMLLAPPEGQTAAWAGLDMAAVAAQASGLRVALYNDGNAACWAERAAHPRPRPQNFAFLLVDTFLAAGIVAEDRLWQGATGASANLGSMVVIDRQGASRFVHDIASVHALRRRLAAAGHDADAPERAGAAPLVAEWVEDAAFALAQTVLNVATVLECRIAIVDSVLPRAITDALVLATGRHVAAFPAPGRRSPRVVAGHLARSGAAEGAALLRLHRRYFSREYAHIEG